jgi:hypothetical protein
MATYCTDVIFNFFLEKLQIRDDCGVTRVRDTERVYPLERIPQCLGHLGISYVKSVVHHVLHVMYGISAVVVVEPPLEGCEETPGLRLNFEETIVDCDLLTLFYHRNDLEGNNYVVYHYTVVMKHLKYSRPFVQALGFLIGLYRLRFGFSFRHFFVNGLSLFTSMYWLYHNLTVYGQFSVAFLVSVGELCFILYLLNLKKHEEEDPNKLSNSLKIS